MKWIKLCNMVAQGKRDWAFAQLARAQGHASHLDLSADSVRTAQATIHDMWSDYIAEFPREQVSQEMPSTTLEAHTVNNVQHTTAIRARSRIESEHEYQLLLAAWGQACEKAVEEVVDEYIVATIVWIQCEHDAAPIEQR